MVVAYPELDVLGDVVGGQADGRRVSAAGGADAEGAVVQDGGDVPQGAVAHKPVAGGQAAVVTTGDDPVADAGRQPVVQARSGRGDVAPGDAVGADAGVELADGPVVDGLQHRDQIGRAHV